MSLLRKKLERKNKGDVAKPISKDPKGKPRNISVVQKNKRSIEIFLEDNKLPIYKLKSVDFSIFDKETFARKSVCEIENPSRNLDLYHSLEDPRLGTIRSDHLCALCDKTTEECPGHFGRIKVGFKFIHPLYRQIVISVLQCICHSCNKLILQEPILKKIKKSGYDRLMAISELSKKDIYKCLNPDCGAKKIFKNTDLKKLDNSSRVVMYEVKMGKETSGKKTMSIETVLSRLRNISKKDIEQLGFKHTHPKDFIMDYIPIIPLTDRPPSITDAEKKDHSLTYAYNDILTKYLDSKHHIDENEQEECYKKIVSIYSLLIINKKGEPDCYTRNQQEPIVPIKDMINHKEGIIRNNLLGKRCDYTGRSVLGPNTYLNFGCLAPPD